MVGAHFTIHSIHIDLFGLGKVVRGSVYSTKVPRTKKWVCACVCVGGGGGGGERTKGEGRRTQVHRIYNLILTKSSIPPYTHTSIADTHSHINVNSQ